MHRLLSQHLCYHFLHGGYCKPNQLCEFFSLKTNFGSKFGSIKNMMPKTAFKFGACFRFGAVSGSPLVTDEWYSEPRHS